MYVFIGNRNKCSSSSPSPSCSSSPRPVPVAVPVLFKTQNTNLLSRISSGESIIVRIIIVTVSLSWRMTVCIQHVMYDYNKNHAYIRSQHYLFMLISSIIIKFAYSIAILIAWVFNPSYDRPPGMPGRHSLLIEHP